MLNENSDSYLYKIWSISSNQWLLRPTACITAANLLPEWVLSVSQIRNCYWLNNSSLSIKWEHAGTMEWLLPEGDAGRGGSEALSLGFWLVFLWLGKKEQGWGDMDYFLTKHLERRRSRVGRWVGVNLWLPKQTNLPPDCCRKKAQNADQENWAAEVKSCGFWPLSHWPKPKEPLGWVALWQR